MLRNITKHTDDAQKITGNSQNFIIDIEIKNLHRQHGIL